MCAYSENNERLRRLNKTELYRYFAFFSVPVLRGKLADIYELHVAEPLLKR
jgi:hypothetical protein